MLDRIVSSALQEYERTRPDAHRALAVLLADYAVCAAQGQPCISTSALTAPGPCHVLGSSSRADPSAAASANAAAAHAYDRDDLHWEAMVHPGSIVWSSVLAAAEMRRTADDVARAAFLGYELAVGIAVAMGAEHRRSWHPTTTAGTLAAAAAATVALGGGMREVVTAVAHAASVAGGIVRPVAQNAHTRLFYRAHAARTGLYAADRALAGVTSPLDILEGPGGVFDVMARQPDPVQRDWSPVGHCRRVSLRLHHACAFAHPAIEAALRLGTQGIDSRGSRVVVEVHPTAQRLASRRDPGGVGDNWWSIEHAVATVLVTGLAPAAESRGSPDEASQAMDVARVAAEIQVVASDVPLHSARISVVGSTRGDLKAEVPVVLGHPDNPAPEGEILRKWRGQLDAGGGEAVGRQLIAASARLLDGQGQVQQVADLLVDSGRDAG